MKKNRDIPQLPPNWKAAFQGTAMRTSFCLSLTQPMMEMLCAVADGVRWDRALYYRQYGMARPDNWIAASTALQKRGLIGPFERTNATDAEWLVGIGSSWRLTPAGEALVQLLKVAGIFVEADAAIVKRASGEKR